MRVRLLSGLAICLLLPGQAAAQQADPLRLVPAQAELLVKVENPRQLFNAVYQHDLVQELLRIDTIRELYDTTNARRFLQLLAYFEKKLGQSGLELLDQVAGGGIVLAAKFSDPGAALVVIQGKNEKMVSDFYQLGLEVVEQELGRQEAKQKIKKGTYRKIDGVRLGDKVFLAQMGGNIVFATDNKLLQEVIDIHLDAKKNASQGAAFQAARKTLPKEPLLWVWLDMEKVRQIPQVKTALETLSIEPQSLIIQGGLIDILKRTPFVGASLEQQGKDFLIAVRMPVGRQGMAPISAMVLPEDDRGSLPLLHPPGTLASVSYYLDLGKLWENRGKILNEKQAKALEDFDQNSGRFLAGSKLSMLLKQAGRHQRWVVAQEPTSSYKTKPATPIPSFAVIIPQRAPEFSTSMNTILRGAALLGGLQFSLKMVEEKRGEHTIVSYFFPEDKKVDNDPNGFRFNFSPCFAAVGDQFIASSTVELARDLVDLVAKEKGVASPATMRLHLFASGAAQALKGIEDQLLVQTILSQGLPPASARKQLDAFLAVVDRLGSLQFEVNYGKNDFRYDIRWKR